MENSKKILIVEDDADISMVEEAYLESAGFETRILSEGTEVEGVIEKEHFDLILLDLMLPGKNGYEICREIRDRVDIPILMVTARTESVDKIRGLGIGAEMCIRDRFKGKFRIPFNPKFINYQQAISVQTVDKLVPVFKMHSAQGIQDPGKICHQHRNTFFQKGIGNAACKEGFPSTDISPEEKTGGIGFHIFPVLHIFVGVCHLRVDAVIFVKCIIIKCLIL